MKNKIDKEEISLGLSLLKKNKIEIDLPKNIRDELDDNILFRGHDLIFKKLIKKSNVYLEYGSGKSTLWTLKNTNTKVYNEDFHKWFNQIKSEQIYDLIFIDPPFNKDLIADVFDCLKQKKVYSKETVFYLESETNINLNFLDDEFEIFKEKIMKKKCYRLLKIKTT